MCVKSSSWGGSTVFLDEEVQVEKQILSSELVQQERSVEERAIDVFAQVLQQQLGTDRTRGEWGLERASS